MREWRLDDSPIFEVGPLTEYLAALNYGARREARHGRIILVVGDSGTGKTIGARVFCQEQTRTSPVYLPLPGRDMLSPRTFLGLLGAPVGMTFGLHEPRFDVGRRLAEDSLERPRIFLLDDAQGLARGGLLDLVRWLHDTGAHTYILIGSFALERVLGAYPELASRVGVRHRMRLPTREEIEPFFAGFPEDAIEAIYSETGGRMRQLVALRDWLGELAEQGKLDIADLSAKRVGIVARHALAKVA